MSKQQEQMYDIFEAAEELQLSPAYIRLQIRNGTIKSVKTPTHEGSNVTKHMVSKSELYAFANRENARAPRRTDGRGKHCFYALPEEVDRLKELLYGTHDPGLMIVAESILTNGKETTNERYVPPSKLRAKDE